MWTQDIWTRLQETIKRLGWEERLIIGVVILASLVAVALYAVWRVRNWMRQPIPSLSEHLTEFRRMRDAGEIDDKEFHEVVNTASRQRSDRQAIPAQPRPVQPENVPSPTQGG